MSRHVAPHRWADAFAGTLSDSTVAAMDAHASGCPRCARARERVRHASQSFPALREQSAPELAWDSIRARIRWAVSSNKRTQSRPRRRLLPVLAIAAVAGGGVAVALTLDRPSSRPSSRTTSAVAQPAPVPSVARPEPEPLTALVVRESGETRQSFDDVIEAGDVITTGGARLDVQFDEASAFALAPHSIVAVRRLDSEQIELLLQQGTLDVTVAKRSPGQRFVVALASGRSVEVRGTQFRIIEEPAMSRVQCAHGTVALRDASGEVEVGGAREIAVGARADVVSVRPSELSAVKLKALVEATPLTMPVWPGASALAAQSAALELATDAAREIRVDGVELGTAPMRVRVMPGRHTVEVADSRGRFRRVGWVDAAAGKPARLDAQPEEPASSRAGVAARKRQLLASLDRRRVASCTRAIAKSGVTDTFVRIEMAVDDTGAVQFLNVIDTDLPSTTASCVRDAIADVRFAAGPSATFRLELDL